jgi:simple sugar transport system permease protein
VAAHIFLGGHELIALVVAMVSASVVSILFGVLVVVLRVNQVIAGLAMVFFCQGLTNLIGSVAGWTNHAVAGLGQFRLGSLADIPILGRIIFAQDLVVYLTIPIFALCWWILTRTNVGLRLRAVGENPEAADAAGINVVNYRFAAIMIGSALVGLAGGYLSIVSTKIWYPEMTGGRGWIAVALVIFARWQPWRALGGAILFGGIEAGIPQIAATGLHVNQYFVLMTPYAATLAVMIWGGRSMADVAAEPGALGQPFVREERR